MNEMNNGFDPNLVIYTPDQTEAIEDHITEHFGDFPKVFRDNSPKDVKVDIAVIPPDDDRYFLTLVTMGNSSRQGTSTRRTLIRCGLWSF